MQEQEDAIEIGDFSEIKRELDKYLSKEENERKRLFKEAYAGNGNDLFKKYKCKIIFKGEGKWGK